MADKLKPQSLTDRFMRLFCEAIIRGDMIPGKFIPSEGDIADEYGVSRSVVREGIRELASLGLVNKRQGRRSKIAPRDDWDLLNPHLLAVFLRYTDEKIKILDDLFTVRMLIECQAAADAALRHSERDLDNMRAQLTLMEELIEDPESFIQADMAFHTAVYKASGNLVVASILNLLTDLLQASRTFTTQSPSALQGALRQHQRSFEAILAGDSETAREAIWQHLTWSRRTLNLTLSVQTKKAPGT